MCAAQRSKSVHLLSSVEYLPGVGPKRAELLGKLGIHTVEDLLHHFPRKYRQRSALRPIADVAVGEMAAVKGRIADMRFRRRGWRRSTLTVLLEDDGGRIYAQWFDQPYLLDKLEAHREQELILYGKVSLSKYLKAPVFVAPEHEVVEEDDDASDYASDKIIPFYDSTASLSQKVLRKLIAEALDRFADTAPDIFSPEFREGKDLIDLPAALRDAHRPETVEAKDRAKRRLIYEEFFLLETAMALRRQEIKSEEGRAFVIDEKIDSRIRRRFPFDFTAAQDKVIAEIKRDMTSSRPMNRLLEGDVGSGKTAVALYAVLAGIANGCQTAVMAPTEILAEQHFAKFSHYLAGSKVRILSLLGGSPPKQRQEDLARVREGQVDLVVGTHAVIQKDVEFHDLGVIVVDEQHKFGVLQRASLRSKGTCPDVLVMTATPIPRTLSLTVFGDLEVSVIDELPPGRTPVKTRWVTSRKRQDAFEFVRKQLRQGRQAFCVYPLVEKSEKLDLQAASDMVHELRAEEFADFQVGLIHGRMKREEKDEAMQQFRDQKFHVLVATTVIEVGIDVPNATVMVIEHAERFGLAQLHQLRGRIGRAEHQSYCLLFGTPKTEDGKKQLRTVASISDGFRLAEEDLKMRGPGEFFGTQQHGLPELKVGDLIEDYPVLRSARQDAFALIDDDPGLQSEGNLEISRKVLRKFEHRLGLVSAG